MKKFLYLFFIIGSMAFASEIIPEYFLMQKTLLPLSRSATYVSNNNRLKAIQVTSSVMKNLKVKESPFYIYDSNGDKQIVRIGDYIVSAPKLATVFVIKKLDFENSYRDENAMNEDISTTIEENINMKSDIDVDESYGNFHE